jgi:hypothetical protein
VLTLPLPMARPGPVINLLSLPSLGLFIWPLGRVGSPGMFGLGSKGLDLEVNVARDEHTAGLKFSPSAARKQRSKPRTHLVS